MEIWSCLKHTLKAKSFAISSNWSFSSRDKVVSAGLFTDGLWIYSFPVQGLLWLESNSQTNLKAEIGGHAPAGRKKALAQSLSKSLLMLETCQKSPCSLVIPLIAVWHWMQPLFAFSYCSWVPKARILKWFASPFSSGPCLSEFSTLTCPSWLALYDMAHSLS